MKKITEINLNNKNVLIRVDYNVPLDGKEIVNDYRIKKSIKTIKYCLDANANVILMSHMGRPKGQVNNKYSLGVLIKYLEELFERDIIFSSNPISNSSKKISKSLKNSKIHLLENLRFHKSEEENCKKFAKSLSEHADIYINDAFGIYHRKHASNNAILKYFSKKNVCYGYLIEQELMYVNLLTNKPKKPYVVVIGGSKIEGKIQLISKFIDKADVILIGGGMAFTFLKSKGFDIGNSIIDIDNIKNASLLLDKAINNNVTIILPSDVTVAYSIENKDSIDVKNIEEIGKQDMGLDIGPMTCINFEHYLSTAKTVIWNGPLGVYEENEFNVGTQSIASIILDLTKNNKITSIIGGGDTIAALENCDLDAFSHVSTGGGACLELLSRE